MSILRELWTKESVDPEIKTTYQYVLDLRERIQDTCELASQELAKVQLRNQGYYNRKTRDRTFQVGEKILLLLPTVHNKMGLQWKGPYSVVKKVSNLDYQIKMDNKIKTFHVNMLKRYVERVENVPETMVQTHRLAAVASVLEDKADESDLSLKDSDLITHYTVSAKETYLDVNINSELPDYRKKAIKNLLFKYSCGPRDINFTCGCSAYNVRSACEIKTAHQAEKLNPITTGKINGKMGRVLRDTGATCIVVKESFVEKCQFTGGKE